MVDPSITALSLFRHGRTSPESSALKVVNVEKTAACHRRSAQRRLVDQPCLMGQEPAENVTRGLESLCHLGTSNNGGPRLLSTVMSGVCNPGHLRRVLSPRTGSHHECQDDIRSYRAAAGRSRQDSPDLRPIRGGLGGGRAAADRGLPRPDRRAIPSGGAPRPAGGGT